MSYLFIISLSYLHNSDVILALFVDENNSYQKQRILAEETSITVNKRWWSNKATGQLLRHVDAIRDVKDSRRRLLQQNLSEHWRGFDQIISQRVQRLHASVQTLQCRCFAHKQYDVVNASFHNANLGYVFLRILFTCNVFMSNMTEKCNLLSILL